MDQQEQGRCGLGGRLKRRAEGRANGKSVAGKVHRDEGFYAAILQAIRSLGDACQYGGDISVLVVGLFHS